MRCRVLIRRITRAPARWRRRRAIQSCAAELRAFGISLPTSEWRLYRQLLRSHRGVARAAQLAGVTAAEAEAGFRRFGDAMREAAAENP